MVKNVVTPSLLLIGEKDKRVPHTAAYYYYHALQEMGVEAKLLSYPDSGHLIINTE
jgi:acylaminoacyl-peptidase